MTSSTSDLRPWEMPTHEFLYVPAHYPFDEICLKCGLFEEEGAHEGRREYEGPDDTMYEQNLRNGVDTF